MRSDCIDAVRRAAGRMLTQPEVKDIEERIARNQRALAVKDQSAYLAMSPTQRLQEAAKLAAAELQHEAIKKKQRMALTIQAHDRIDNYLKDQKAKYGHDKLNALRRIVAFSADRKSDNQSIETRAAAIGRDYVRQMVDTFENISPKIFGLFKEREGVRALTYELFGVDSKAIVSPEAAQLAKEGAKAWNKTADSARKAFNAAGGDIGKLEDWRMPQSHSQVLVAKAGEAKWTQDIFGKLDRSRYMNADGSAMSDPQMMAFLKETWTTIATGGANKVEPGKVTGAGMRANQGAEERSVHFKDPEGYLEYQQKYGGKDAYSAMMHHIMKLGDDIAMVETLGPNPDLAFKYWMDKGVQEEKIANPKAIGKIQARAASLKNLYDYVGGKTQPVANARIAAGFDTLRNFLSSSRLGSAYITSITDNATMQLGAHANNMSHLQLMRNQLQTMNMANKDELRMARRAGLSLQTLIGEMNRFGVDAMLPSFSSKMANLTIRTSGLNAVTEARRRAFGVTMFGSIGSTVEKTADFASIEAGDKRLFESKGIDEQTFNVWKKAQLEDWGSGNDHMLTPESVYQIPDAALQGMGDPAELRRNAALNLLGMVNEEVDMGVIEPGAADKSMMKGGLQRGTWKGEVMRSMFLFKGFPLATINRHFMRGITANSAGGKAAYIASLIASTTLLGAVAQQFSQFVGGKDLQDMSSPKFWLASLLKGGSLGIYGDFLFDTNTQYGSSPLSILSGPVAGLVEDFISLTQGNAAKASQGQKTHFGAEAIKFLKTNIPLQNLWYTKAITDRMIFNQLQEMASPGYMRRVQQRAQKDFGQSFWWRPDSALPDRAPGFAKK